MPDAVREPKATHNEEPECVFERPAALIDVQPSSTGQHQPTWPAAADKK